MKVATSWLLLGLAILGASPGIAAAGDEKPGRLHPRVAKVLGWLPEDTETLFVSRGLALPKPDEGRDPMPTRRWPEVGLILATQELEPRRLGSLPDRKVDFIIRGSRNYKAVSSLGSLRSENCIIILFGDHLGDAGREWTTRIREEAESVRTIVGREVFAFPSGTVMEPAVDLAPWQGTYYTLIGPDALLCASSDRYLEAVLRRADGAAGPRALPDDLPEWKYVDFEAPVWMLRHRPGNTAKAGTSGVTVSFAEDVFRVTYVPASESSPSASRARQYWTHFDDDRRLSDLVKIGRQGDRTVVVSCHLKTDEAEETAIATFGFPLGWAEAHGYSDESDWAETGTDRRRASGR